MTRVAIVTTEPTASRVPQLDRLARREGLDLMVFYAAETVQRRAWSLVLDHPHEILRGPSLPTTRLLQHDYPITPSLWRKLGGNTGPKRLNSESHVRGGTAVIAFASVLRAPMGSLANLFQTRRLQVWRL